VITEVEQPPRKEYQDQPDQQDQRDQTAHQDRRDRRVMPESSQQEADRQDPLVPPERQDHPALLALQERTVAAQMAQPVHQDLREMLAVMENQAWLDHQAQRVLLVDPARAAIVHLRERRQDTKHCLLSSNSNRRQLISLAFLLVARERNSVFQ